MLAVSINDLVVIVERGVIAVGDEADSIDPLHVRLRAERFLALPVVGDDGVLGLGIGFTRREAEREAEDERGKPEGRRDRSFHWRTHRAASLHRPLLARLYGSR